MRALSRSLCCLVGIAPATMVATTAWAQTTTGAQYMLVCQAQTASATTLGVVRTATAELDSLLRTRNPPASVVPAASVERALASAGYPECILTANDLASLARVFKAQSGVAVRVTEAGGRYLVDATFIGGGTRSVRGATPQEAAKLLARLVVGDSVRTPSVPSSASWRRRLHL